MIAIDNCIPSGAPKMTKKSIQDICREQKLFQTPSLNDILYLHYQGFTKIQNLEEYTNLRSLWLQCNGIKKIENLDNQMELRFINLNSNVIDKIENLEILSKLTSIDLGHNMITKIENLSQLSNLRTLDITNNYIETMEDIEHLRDCKSLKNIDLAHNSITDPNAVEVFANMACLKTLSLIGNPLIGKIRNYRKMIILKCKNLTALDERLINTVERKAVEAWAVGGVEAEKKVYEEDFEIKKKQRKELVDDLMRNRIIIREKAQAKWRKRKSEKVESEKHENEQYEDDTFYPDLLGSEDSSLSLSGIEDLDDDLYPESESESCPNRNIEHKTNLILTDVTDAVPPSSGVLTSNRIECDTNHTNKNKVDSEEIIHGSSNENAALNEELSSDISENKIAKTISETLLDNQSLKYFKEEMPLSFVSNQNIDENELNAILSKEHIEKFSSDENEFVHPAFQEPELDETALNKLFEELFLSDEEEKLKYQQDENSLQNKSTQLSNQDLSQNKKNECDISDFNTKVINTPKCVKETQLYKQNEKLHENKSKAEQYQNSYASILNCMKQEKLIYEQLFKTNHEHHISETIANHMGNTHEIDTTMNYEKNSSNTVNTDTVEGMEEYRIKRGEEELEQICQTPIPYIKDKKPSMKINSKQAKTLFEKLF